MLALHFTNGMSSREIAETTGDGKTTINEFLKRFQQCGVLKYPLPEDVTSEHGSVRMIERSPAGRSELRAEDG